MSVTSHMLEQSVSAKANPSPARPGQCGMIWCNSLDVTNSMTIPDRYNHPHFTITLVLRQFTINAYILLKINCISIDKMKLFIYRDSFTNVYSLLPVFYHLSLWHHVIVAVCIKHANMKFIGKILNYGINTSGSSIYMILSLVVGQLKFVWKKKVSLNHRLQLQAELALKYCSSTAG